MIRCGFVFAALVVCQTAFAQIGNVNFTVEGGAGSNTSRISPLIYGANFATRDQAFALNLPLNRSGGNATTRYNWLTDATSSGSDWYFLSHTAGGTSASESVDSWISENNNSGVPSRTLSMVTLPIIGWVAKIQANRDSMWSFSVSKYGAQQAVEPWHSDAGNGVKPNGTPVTGNDPNDANIPVAISYQQGWLNHLVSRFGTAAGGGVTYYLLDNEPALWQETHRDVFPNGVTMQALFEKERDAALLAKSVDPTALVCGPEEWGWLGYLYSGSDFQWLQAHGWQGNPPDRAAHNNLDCVAFLLQQFKAASTAAGKRLLDVFTLHYYPQGSYSWTDNSENAQLWRNRATRSLWDPNYTDESWIGQKIDLIHRMKGWVNAYYPSTKLGITEYTWGDDNNMSAALAQADAFGIFGREGVDLATRWVCPATGSLTFRVFQMYRNYDGQGATFGNVVRAMSPAPNPDTLSAFASYDSATKECKVMLIHKRLSGVAPATITPGGLTGLSPARVYRLTAANSIVRLADVSAANGKYALDLPSQSITLLIYKSR